MTARTEEVLATYTLQVIGPVNDDGTAPHIEFKTEYLLELEENINDLLPKGFRARIKEWDE